MPSISASHNHEAYTVSELSGALKKTVEDSFGYVRVRGEMSGCKRAGSGHCYFDLKDDKAVLNAVCWKGTAEKLGFAIENGLEVIATGRLSTYPGRSSYQLVVDRLEPAGVGALMALLEKRRKMLEAEGLFDASRKRPLPFLPRVIGVVTSPTGAVIRDILHRIEERFPCHVLVWPVRVQGEGAAKEIAAAITGFNALPENGACPRPDLLIVARGGGSLEDLWAFNEEIVVRAAAASNIPLISAVGHETDTTLIDFASDKRAPTPTAAAEIAVPVLADWRFSLSETGLRMQRALLSLLTHHTRHVEGLARGLPRLDQLLGQATQRLDHLSGYLPRALLLSVGKRQAQLEKYGVSLSARRLRPRLGILTDQWLRLGERLHAAPSKQVALKEEAFRALSARLSPQPYRLHEEKARHALVFLHKRAEHAWSIYLEQRTASLRQAALLLDALDYHQVLRRGYALVTDRQGVPVTSVAAFPAQGADIRFADGAVRVIREGTSPSRRRSRTEEGGKMQKNLFDD